MNNNNLSKTSNGPDGYLSINMNNNASSASSGAGNN